MDESIFSSFLTQMFDSHSEAIGNLRVSFRRDCSRVEISDEDLIVHIYLPKRTSAPSELSRAIRGRRILPDSLSLSAINNPVPLSSGKILST